MTPRSLLLTVTFTAGALTSGLGAQVQYTDLGTLGGPSAGALGLNDVGQVVGWSTLPGGCTTANGAPCRRAFLWDNGNMTDLGLLAGDEDSVARAINNAGTITGTSERDVIAGFGVYHGFVWSGGTLTPLPDLGLGQSWANDINEAGTIIGYSTDPGPVRDRVVTWSGGSITNVGSTDSHSYNRGYGLNDSGLLVGFAWDLFSPNDSILYDGATWFTIGGFGQFQNSEAKDVSNAGIVVGAQAFPNGDWHPAIWLTPGQDATDLGMLPGYFLGELTSVNEAGHAVGRCYTDTDSRAVYYDGTQMVDLNDLLPPGVNVQLWDASEINENGDIVGTALDGGQFRPYLLSLQGAGGSYCDSLANSTGSTAAMEVVGSTSLAANDFELRAAPLPNQPYLFYYGPDQVQLPFGDGVRCVGGNTVRLGPPQFATTGSASRVVDVVAEGFTPGSVNFQCWFRDPGAMGAGFNLSDGYEVVFLP